MWDRKVVTTALDKRFLSGNQTGELPCEYFVGSSGVSPRPLDLRGACDAEQARNYKAFVKYFEREQAQHLSFVCLMSKFLGVS